MSASPVRPHSTRIDVALSWLVGLVVFLFRQSSLRDLTNDHYMHLSWAQQVLFGELPGRDFVDPGMPLAWGLSAVAQAISAGPFSESALSSVMFGITAGLTCWVVTRLTDSRVAGVIAAVSAATLVPRLYNYPKLLVPALTLCVLQRYVEQRSPGRRVEVGLGLAAAVLFRHDLGLYASIVAAVAIVVAHRDSIGTAVRELLLVGGTTALALLPYIVYVGWAEGLFEHVRRGIEFSKGESHQLDYDWPNFPSRTLGSPPWSREDATAFLYYFSWVLPVAALSGLRRADARSQNDRLPLALAAITFLALYLPIILRYPLDQRLPDIATPLVIVAALLGVAAVRAVRGVVLGTRRSAIGALSALAGAATIAIMAVAVYNASYLGKFPDELQETRIERGPAGVLAKIRSIREDGTAWPWAAFWPNSGGLPDAVMYIRNCVPANAYVLLTWPSPEYYFFAQRRFAAGHSMFLPPSAFTTERDQAFMIARLSREQPPIALINRTRGEQFKRAYPLVDAYISSHYTEAASYKHYDDDDIAIGIRRDLTATSRFGRAGWPCGLISGTDQK